MRKHTRHDSFPPRWVFLVAALMIIGGLVWNVQMQMTATAEKNTAQGNATTLALDIQSICSSTGKLMVDNRDVCTKGADVLANPTESIPGPSGKDGVNGLDSTVPGPPGKDGDDSVTPGPSGKDGINGLNGLDSVVPGPPGKDGTNGLNGLDSVVPGPSGKDGINGLNGLDGANGIDGAPGSPPTSFSWTDSKSGAVYICVPDPIGSTNYQCSENQAPATTTYR